MQNRIITNRLVINGDPTAKQAMFDAIQNVEVGLGSIDFEKILPMPGSIYRGELSIKNREIYGTDNWYDWSISNWGTIWNSYGYSIDTTAKFDGSTLIFDTAWSCPFSLIEALVRQYPSLNFKLSWTSEEIGSEVGQKEYNSGKEVFTHIPDSFSKEAMELSATVIGLTLSELGYVYNEATDKYDYIDIEEEIEQEP